MHICAFALAINASIPNVGGAALHVCRAATLTILVAALTCGATALTILVAALTCGAAALTSFVAPLTYGATALTSFVALQVEYTELRSFPAARAGNLSARGFRSA